MKVDYTIFYKKKIYSIDEFARYKEWNLFISAYNDSERVNKIFNNVHSKEKHWLILPDYCYGPSEYPTDGEVFPNIESENRNESECESDFIRDFFVKLNNNQNFSENNLCIDITGFMRTHLIFLIRYLMNLGIKKFDAIYTDPISYSKKENTTFTIDNVYQVRQIAGCEGIHSPNTSNDILIIGSGYDHKLIASVSESKAKAKKIQVFGFPSLQPDMYQENILRAYKAEEAIGANGFMDPSRSYFAPANDPFITANVIQQIVKRENDLADITNLYLSPLSTKAQTLGFVLYFLWECLDKPVSIIFPYCHQYTRESSKGVSKIWIYSVELPL